MRRLHVYPTATLLLLSVVAVVYAQGTNAYNAGYPKASTMSPIILAEGVCTPDTANGWSLTGGGQIAFWEKGKTVDTVTISVDKTTGKWSGSITTAVKGTKYYVVGQAVVIQGMTPKTLATDPVEVTAP